MNSRCSAHCFCKEVFRKGAKHSMCCKCLDTVSKILEIDMKKETFKK